MTTTSFTGSAQGLRWKCRRLFVRSICDLWCVWVVWSVVESHPINDRTDIFVHPTQIAHFPALAKYCESFDLDTKDLRTRRHIPYIAILHQHMKKWQAAVHTYTQPSTPSCPCACAYNLIFACGA
jgi:hypothetical protein